jgi:hypothetical protein
VLKCLVHAVADQLVAGFDVQELAVLHTVCAVGRPPFCLVAVCLVEAFENAVLHSHLTVLLVDDRVVHTRGVGLVAVAEAICTY